MNTCWLCGANGCADPLDKHHIFGGSNRKKSERMGLVVYLCHHRCHIFGKKAVHQDKETMLKRRYAPDADSADMLDIIYANRSFDIGYVGNWNSITTMGDSSIAAGRAPKMNAYNRASTSVAAQIDKEYQDFLLVGKDTAETPAE